jgi:hypothetical protein
MDVFRFRDHIIADYHRYVSSFISVSEVQLRHFVNHSFESGKLWPDPLIQLNPTFKSGKTVDELTKEGLLHADCSRVFRRDKTSAVDSGEPFLLLSRSEELGNGSGWFSDG